MFNKEYKVGGDFVDKRKGDSSVVKWLTHSRFTPTVAGPVLMKDSLKVTRTQSPCEKSKVNATLLTASFLPQIKSTEARKK
jgi:hypothetical protein